MSRWAPDARERIRQAALELFAEQGFAATTVPQISQRAGLTRRTFFRHFSDKREVFFGDTEIPDIATRMLAEAPRDAAAMTVIVASLHELADRRFEPRRSEIRFSRAIIDADPGLRERDLRKRAELAAAVHAGFVERGEDELTAAVLASVVVDTLHIALDRWIAADDTGTLRTHLDETLARMRALVG